MKDPATEQVAAPLSTPKLRFPGVNNALLINRETKALNYELVSTLDTVFPRRKPKVRCSHRHRY